MPISNPKPDLHNINAHTKFGQDPFMFTQVIRTKERTDGHTDVQRETISVWRGIKMAKLFANIGDLGQILIWISTISK